jgi:hypothetical protein
MALMLVRNSLVADVLASLYRNHTLSHSDISLIARKRTVALFGDPVRNWRRGWQARDSDQRTDAEHLPEERASDER